MWDRDVLESFAEHLLELGVDLSRDVEQRVFEVPLDVSRLVAGFGLAVADLGGLPEARHLSVDVALHLGFLGVREQALVEGFEVASDGTKLRFHRLPACLGGMGGEGRLDQDVVEEGVDGGDVDVGRGEFVDRRTEAVGQRPILGGRADRRMRSRSSARLTSSK